jgi:hypothetical protein
MRELRLRVFDKQSREYVRPDYGLVGFCYPLDGRVEVLDCNGDILPNCIIEQYTGLKDKNGKEIYEGDIVDDGYSRICKIRWSEKYAGFKAVNENDGYGTNIWFVSKYGEVIGNIHENGDLLNDTED